MLNAISAAVWAALFSGLGYVFGAGAQQIIGRALLHHERVLVALAIGLVIFAIAFAVARTLIRRERVRESSAASSG